MTAKKDPVLPDLLEPGLKLVFCGTAAGTVSAQRGAYYAHPQNKFWRALHESGITSRQFAPSDYAEVLKLGIGLTDIAKHVYGQDSELPPQSLGRLAVEDLRTRILAASPRILAFTSLTGGRRVMGPKASFGPQKELLGGTKVWVLPSPSPKASWNWNGEIWLELGKAFRKL